MPGEVTIEVETKTWFAWGPFALVTFGVVGGKDVGIIAVVWPWLICIDVTRKWGLSFRFSAWGEW